MIVGLCASAAAAAQPTLTLGEAIEAAATGHPAIARAEAARAAASSRRKQARANYGPRLTAEANALVWNDEITFGFAPEDGPPIELPPPMTPYEGIVAGLFTAEPTVVRDQFTWDASITLAQPLTALWAIYHGVRAAGFAEESATLEIDEARRQYVRDAIVAYFRVLQTRAAVATAEQSVAQLEAQGERVKALVEAGSVQRGEQLRIEVALAALRQQVLQNQANLELSRAALALAVNEAAGARVDAAAWSVERLPDTSGTLEDAIADAIANRTELRRLQYGMQQAEIGVLAERADYLPQLAAIAQYKHQEGQGLSGKDNAFVGATLSWSIFEWGARKHAVDAAAAQIVQLEATQELTRRQIALQVEKTWRDVRTAVASHAVAASAVAQAEEAYRVAEAQFEVGQTTATDLLAAQTALTEARNNQNAALYQAWVNEAELTYATGRPLENFGGLR